MAARDAMRNTQWLEGCQVAPALFAQVMPRLAPVLTPFVASFGGRGLPEPAKTSVSGLLSNVERKNVASMAEHFGQDRLGLHGCIGGAEGADTHRRQVKL